MTLRNFKFLTLHTTSPFMCKDWNVTVFRKSCCHVVGFYRVEDYRSLISTAWVGTKKTEMYARPSIVEILQTLLEISSICSDKASYCGVDFIIKLDLYLELLQCVNITNNHWTKHAALRNTCAEDQRGLDFLSSL